MDKEDVVDRPYQCDIKITFPTQRQAHIAKRVMEVDREVGNRVQKILQWEPNDPQNLMVYVSSVCVCVLWWLYHSESAVHDGYGTNLMPVFFIFAYPPHFRMLAATDLKSLRVAISSFYDYLTVSLKCFQEFDDTDGEAS
jgi:hypothetical protein